MLGNDNTKAKLISIITSLALATSSFAITTIPNAFADDVEDANALHAVEEQPFASDDSTDAEFSDTNGAEADGGVDEATTIDDPSSTPDAMDVEDGMALPEEAVDTVSDIAPLALTDEPVALADYPDGITWETITNPDGESGTAVWGMSGSTLYIRPPDGAATGTLPSFESKPNSTGKLTPWQTAGVTKAVILPGVIVGEYCCMFNMLYRMTEIEGLENLDLSNTKSTEGMFFECRALTSLTLPDWNAPKLIDTSYMFWDCEGLLSLTMGAINAPALTTAIGTFQACKKLVSIDLSKLNAPNVVDLMDLFYQDAKLTSIIWPKNMDTSKVQSMIGMFKECTSLETVDLSEFNTTSVITMAEMFYGCKALKELDLSSFNIQNVKDMEKMFYLCPNLASLDLSSFDTANVSNVNATFTGTGLKKVLIGDKFTLYDQLNNGRFWYTLAGSGKCEDGKIPAGEPGTYAVVEIILEKTAITLPVSSAPFSIGYTVTPEMYTDKVVWSTSSSTATVDKNGLITLNKGGSVRIYASLFDEVVKSSCLLTVVQVTLTEPTKTVSEKTKSFTLKAKVTPSSGRGPTTWASSNPDVVTVSSSGTVTVKGKGTAEISATCDGDTAICMLTVISVSLSETSKTTYVGEEPFTLTTTITPDSGPRTITWKSSNTSVATVDSDGTVTPLKAGSATITATVDGVSDAQATCALTVKNADVFLEEISKTVGVGAEPFTLKATVAPSSVTAPITWTSSDPSVATVDSDGKVTVIKAGTAQISAECGGAKAVCALSVVSVTLSDTAKTVGLGAGSITLNATVEPGTLTTPVVWSSSDPGVATVDSSGVVTLKSAGTTEISAECAGIKATCDLTVVSVTLSETSKTVGVGTGSFRIEATVKPDTVIAPVTWSSSNEDVVTVDSEGIVTVHKAGNAEITATCAGAEATCSVTAISVALNEEPSRTVGVNAAPFKLSATVAPDTVTAPVTWSSSDTTVASVSDDGTVTMHKGGYTQIAAKVDGVAGIQDICDLTVVSVELDESQKTAYLGEGPFRLSANVVPDTVTTLPTWDSSDESVATVDANGTVTVHKVGSAMITAEISNIDGTKAICNLTVATPQVTLSETSKTVSVYANPFKLTATITPNTVTAPVTWSSSDAKVATVDSNGTVTVHSDGNASITAKIDGIDGAQAICALQVETPRVIMAETAKTVTINEKPFRLTATITPSTPTGSLTWTSSNPDVATVDADGIVTVQDMGTTSITAMFNGSEAVCVLTVKASLVMSVLSKTVSEDTESFTLTANVIPASLADQITWSSSNPNVATVEANDPATVDPDEPTIMQMAVNLNSPAIARIAGDSTCAVAVRGVGTTYITARLDDSTEAVCILTVSSLSAPSPDGSESSPGPGEESGSAVHNFLVGAGLLTDAGDDSGARSVGASLALSAAAILLLAASRCFTRSRRRAKHAFR